MTKRRASRAVQAREKARARTAERRQREQHLEDLATRWFEVDAERTEVEAAVERKIDAYAARVRGQVNRDTGRLGDEMSAIIREMLRLTGIRSVTERLGVAESVVREAKGERAPSPDGATNGPTPRRRKPPMQAASQQTSVPEPEAATSAAPA